jgi:hypothetical protein
MPEEYSFITHWQLRAPVEKVWDCIYNSMEWPQWWKGVKKVTEIHPNDESGINGVRDYTWKSALPYQLCFTMKLTEKDTYRRLKGIATGELEGTGEWLFSEKEGITDVRYYWNIHTTKKWMNSMAFLLKPVFKFNHNLVMHWGGKGLAEKLGVELLKG